MEHTASNKSRRLSGCQGAGIVDMLRATARVLHAHAYTGGRRKSAHIIPCFFLFSCTFLGMFMSDRDVEYHAARCQTVGEVEYGAFFCAVARVHAR